MDAYVIGPNPHKTAAAQMEIVQPIMGLPVEEFAALAQSIFIMVPNRGKVHSKLFISNGFWARFGTTITEVEDRFGGYVEQMRANMCDLFRRVRKDRPELKFLVMMDDDEAVPWDAPYRLAAWDLPIVSGVVCTYAQERGIFINVFIKDRYGVARMPSFLKTTTIPGKGLKECHSVGAGLVCIRHDVIDAVIDGGDLPFVIADESRREAFETGVMKVGEDTTFCAQARKHGFQSYVDFSVRAPHRKEIDVEWPQSHIDYDIDVRDWEVDPGDYHHG